MTQPARPVFPWSHAAQPFYGAMGKVSSARLYSTAEGIYECRINGHPVSRNGLPEIPSMDKH